MKVIFRALLRAHTAAIDLFALTAELGIAVMFVAIVYDVAARNLVLPSVDWISAAVEYALFGITLLIAPKLVRDKGHIAVQSAVNALPLASRRIVGTAVLLICITLCLVIAYYAVAIGLDSYRRGEFDVRAFDMPRWLLFAWLAAGFLLTAIEFLRLLLRREAIFDVDRPSEGL